MAVRIESVIAFFGCFPIYLADYLANKGKSKKFSQILTTVYHNLAKYLSLCLLLITILVIPPFSDYTATLIKPENDRNSPFYALIVSNLISNVSTYFIAGYASNSNSILMKWTEIFQFLTQSKVSSKIDNAPDTMQKLSSFAHQSALKCIYSIIVRALIIITILTLLYLYEGLTLSFTVYGNNQLIQLTLFTLLTIHLTIFASLDHVNSHLFEILVQYFVLKFRVINDRIAVIVKKGKDGSNNQIKSLDEAELKSILDEHDLLKVNLKLYDKYWSQINIVTLILKPLTCLYCVFQLTFIVQSTASIVFLWLHLIESVYLFTKMFLSGTKVSDEIDSVAANGLRLILFSYSIPVLQRLQLFNQHIMFTEMGFSCGGLFIFTLDSVHDAFIELTQDFLLTLDFVITVRQAKSQLN
ncbi:uncharacterized protein LOC107371544 isoform X1 [Tetranychus urticae]|uniref:Gustatory receptor n=1 Tax=Tetranychus urticae TaxID=32264 RepID=T1JWU7_TETUR|nr:uncharacterized protein LOC107371544 isoform X1 [Tetranychus urticae]XP_015795149.1 uncharacterized protein LOC107371544 isoform X1 [Tetranychus urticae]